MPILIGMGVSGKTVLVIDDDKDLRILARRILEAAGMKVSEAESVLDGIKSILDQPPHLVLLDLNMPVHDGFVFLEKRMGHPKLSLIPVLVVSAQQDLPSVKKALNLNASNYLLKPFKANILLQKVRKVIRESGNQDDLYILPKKIECELTVGAKLYKLNAEGALLHSPMRFGQKRALEIESQLLKTIQCPVNVFKTGDGIELKMSGGLYETRASLVGINEADQVKLEATFRSWVKPS